MTRKASSLFLLSSALSLSNASAAATAPPPNVIFASSFGAVGDGRTLDTASLQRAIDAVPVGGTLRLGPRTYVIDTRVGLKLKSDMRLDLAGATITGANQPGVRCRILEIQGKKRIAILGGTLLGSRVGAPEWGVGIMASDAEDLTISDMRFREFFFDGILITGNVGCRRVRITRCVSDHNRRSGMTMTMGSDVTVEQSTFSNSIGQSPEAGINCETNAGGSIARLSFLSNTFSGNAGPGLYLHKGLGVSVAGANVQGSVVQSNGQGIVISGVGGVTVTANRVARHTGRNKAGITIGGSPSAVVRDNRLDDNYRGILTTGSAGAQILNNTIVGTGAVGDRSEDGVGIFCLGASGVSNANACTVSGNTIQGARASGITAQFVSGVRILNNTIESPGQRGVYLRTTSGSEARGNSVSNSGRAEPGAYDGIELAFTANNNVIAGNTIRRGPYVRRPIGIGAGCTGNQLIQNIVLP